MPQLSERETPTLTTTCLKFAIDSQTIGLLESEFVQEVITVASSHILPVPNKPSCILGILSRRHLAYWGIDLAMLLGMYPLDQSTEIYQVILTSFQDLALAMIVRQVDGLIYIPNNQINYDISSMPSTLRPYLKGSTLQNKSLMYLLKAENILHSTILHS
jgi:twitching motility protein PilI